MIPATLVGLIHTWKSERTTPKNAKRADFHDWLMRHQFDQLAEMINSNTELSQAIDATLQSNHEEVMGALKRIESIIGSAMASSRTLGPIGKVIPRLSDQVIHFLTAINAANATEVLITHPEDGNKSLCILDGDGGIIEAIDPRFLIDDVAQMIELGLLRSGGRDLLYITRLGASVGG